MRRGEQRESLFEYQLVEESRPERQHEVNAPCQERECVIVRGVLASLLNAQPGSGMPQCAVTGRPANVGQLSRARSQSVITRSQG